MFSLGCDGEMATILATNPLLVEATSGKVSWQEAIRRAVRDTETLLLALGLPLEMCGPEGHRRTAASQFPLLVPWEFIARMQPGDADDPLLRQVLPTHQEGGSPVGFSADPVGDQAAELLPGLLQKYASRALLVTTGACAVHCRYCFRREYPYSEVPKSPAAWQPAIDRIAADESIEEVILSGGDPLMLADQSLRWLVDQLNAIPHVQRLRLHTRVPVMIPQRINDELLDWLDRTRMQTIVVTHINHPRELYAPLVEAMGKLRSARALLLNQAVLLRGINDSVAVQRELSCQLIAAGILPYYLHQLDRVRGAGHFEVPVETGREIISLLRAQFSGYGVPKYVWEQAGEPSKRPL